MRARSHHRAGKAPGLSAAGRPWFAPALALAALQLHCGDGGGVAPADASPTDSALADAALADAAPADAAPADAMPADAAPADAPPRAAMPAATGPTGNVGITVVSPGAAISVLGFGRPLSVPDLWPLESVHGHCAVRRAERPRSPPPLQYAGVVTLRGSSGAEYVATPDPPRYSYTGSLPQGIGERVEVQAEGGAVPSFRATFTIPQRLVLVSPMVPELTSGRAVVIRPTEDLALTWEVPQAGPDDLVTVRIDQSRIVREGFIDETLVLCDYSPAAGRGVVPAAALAALTAAGSGGVGTGFRVSLRNLQVLRLGEHAVAVSGEVMAAQGIVEFQ